MKQDNFKIRKSENILAQLQPDRRWFVVTWKVIVGVVNLAALTFLAYSFVSPILMNLFVSFLSEAVANILTSIIVIGIVPMLVAAWVTDDLVRVYTGFFILTNKRLWIRGSPASWSHTEIPMEDISSMAYRRDAIFLRRKSNRKLHVHVISEGQIIVDAFKEAVSVITD